ncbi:hypothetical protein cce_3114 [Crocosphaera subtropica ATCC 51142]|uniref:Uncharacterized protein n=2 Tax=Crocosphaera TaxID=263510 RepID=B1WWZ3_CROS5|nr:hypothetical protein cce_3114 [Crocosphaera subtropica ATCC 51142]
MMTKPNYRNMTRAELKKHLLSDRNNQEAWEIFFEKLSDLDQNTGHSPDLPPEEMEKIFRTKLSN